MIGFVVDRSQVFQASSEGCCDGESAHIGVIFHVILRRRNKEYGGADVPDDRCQLSQEGEFVEDLEILTKGGVKSCPQVWAAASASFSTNLAQSIGRVFQTAARAGGQVHVVSFESLLAAG